MPRPGTDTSRTGPIDHSTSSNGTVRPSRPPSERGRAERHVDGSIARDAEHRRTSMRSAAPSTPSTTSATSRPSCVGFLEAVLATVVVLAVHVMRVDVAERARQQHARARRRAVRARRGTARPSRSTPRGTRARARRDGWRRSRSCRARAPSSADDIEHGERRVVGEASAVDRQAVGQRPSTRAQRQPAAAFAAASRAAATQRSTSRSR